MAVFHVEDDICEKKASDFLWETLYLDSLYNPSTQVIAAEGEQKASRALKEAADVIQESPSALQV